MFFDHVREDGVLSNNIRSSNNINVGNCRLCTNCYTDHIRMGIPAPRQPGNTSRPKGVVTPGLRRARLHILLFLYGIDKGQRDQSFPQTQTRPRDADDPRVKRPGTGRGGQAEK